MFSVIKHKSLYSLPSLATIGSSRSYSITPTICLTNPATTTRIKELYVDTKETILKKATLSRKSQKKWNQVPLASRKEMIMKYRNELAKEKNLNKFALDMTNETGKPLQHSKGEIKGTLERIDYFLNNINKAQAYKEYGIRGGVTEFLDYEPLGVVGNISAWNYPYFVGHNVIIPALLAGNSVIYKPSEYSLSTGLNIDSLLNEFLPEGVFQTLVGGGSAGETLLKESDEKGNRLIDAVFFTGSNETGSKIGAAAGARLIKTQLELGGKDSSYVHKDVDIDLVANALADGGFYNNGQSCCSVERIIVHEDIYEEFLKRLEHHVGALKMGDPKDPETYLGPLTRPQQADILDAQVSDAVSKGAVLRKGGKRTHVSNLLCGVYYEPTILSDCTSDMQVMQNESFGPIVAVTPVSDKIDDVVEKMNDCRYGLTNSVFSKDEELVKSVLSKVNSGTVYWNSCDRVSPQLPWSGRLGSGIGATLGEVGISTFLQPKAYHINRNFNK